MYFLKVFFFQKIIRRAPRVERSDRDKQVQQLTPNSCLTLHRDEALVVGGGRGPVSAEQVTDKIK